MTALDVAGRLVAALEAGDADAVRAVYAPDARIWHNFDGIEQTVDENLATLSWLLERLPKPHYDIERLEELPDGFLQQHVLRGTTRSGAELALPACVICRVENGRITRLWEYLDMAGAAALG